MRPITGTSPGHHVLIECVVNAHCDGVGLSPTQQTSDVKPERGVALAHMLSSQFPVYPDCGRMEYGLKLDPYRGVLPFYRRIKGAPIPGETTIINKSGINLPGVRHEHFEPGADGFMASEPALLLANISRISPEQPWAAQTHGLRRGQVQCFFVCPKSGRANGARSQDSSLRQKLSTRIHGKVPFPIVVMGCQLSRHSGIESTQTKLPILGRVHLSCFLANGMT